MKTVKIRLCDGLGSDDLVFLPILRRYYNVVFSDTPDYVIYGPFGDEHLQYQCIKIFTTGECVTPNFNECDYATGFDFLEFGDRYLRLPLCSIMFRDGKNMLDRAVTRGADLPEIGVGDKDFCSFVVSNTHGMKERAEMFELLSTYKKVDSGGRYRNNVGGPVEDKLLFDHQHKFCITFENESYEGYTTEKIVDAFASGAVPIYYGDPRIGELFNEKAFVNCHDYPSFEAVLKHVVELDQDDALYREMAEQPIYLTPPPGLTELEVFLRHIFDQDLSRAGRVPHNANAARVERRSPVKESRAFRLYTAPYRFAGRIRRCIKNR